MALEAIEDNAFANVGVGKVGVKADGLLIDCKRFLVALKITRGHGLCCGR